MMIWKNSDGKRVCDISEDYKLIEIVQRGCKTRITVKPDGTLHIENVISKEVA